MSEHELTPQQAAWVEQGAPRVVGIARQLVHHASHASLDELVSAGNEGLVRAALRYDPSTGVPFPAFAHYRIRGAMLDAARRANPELRRHQRALRALEASQSVLEQAQRDEEAAADRRSLRERVAAAAEVVQRTTTAVLLSRVPPEDPDTLSTAAEGAEEAYAQGQLADALSSTLAGCAERDRSLVQALYFDGMTMNEYARREGKSVSTVSRHHAKLLTKLGKRLRDHRPA